MILGGVYLLVLIGTPLILSQNINPKDNHTTQLITKTENKITENRLYIPKIDINLPYSTGGAETMEHGAWWRKPENGNPKDGGNFVLSAHRFIMGLTPQQTLRKSPFYNIDKLTVGDEIIIDYNGVRYNYVISEKQSVKTQCRGNRTTHRSAAIDSLFLHFGRRKRRTRCDYRQIEKIARTTKIPFSSKGI